MPDSPTRFIGRATNLAPANRFEAVRQEADHDQLAGDDELLADERSVPTEFLPDRAATLIRENDSPDIPFRYSLNPYRGCEHGCAYCKPYPFSASRGSVSVYPCRDDRNHLQGLGFRLNRGVRR